MLLLTTPLLMMFSSVLGLDPPVQECAKRRDDRLKDQPNECCKLWPYCRCVNSLCAGSKGDPQCNGERKIACEKDVMAKCTDYDGEEIFSKKCSGLKWDVLLDEGWTPPSDPKWDITSADGKSGRAAGGDSKVPLLLGGLIVGGIILLLLLCTAFYCWSTSSKKKKVSKESTQQRSTGKGNKQTTTKTKGKKKSGKRSTAGGGGETSADLADAKSRSKARGSSARNARAAAVGGSDSGKGPQKSRAISKGAQDKGMSSFNSRQVNTVDLKTTGANARVAIRYTKFRNALKP